MQRSRSLPLLLSSHLALCLAACGGAPAAPKTPLAEEAEMPLRLLDETTLAQAAHQFLKGGQSAPDLALQKSVVSYQLARAERLFEAGHEEAGEAVARGALLLLRSSDRKEQALMGRGKALLWLAHRAARRGEAGRARALYSLAEQAGLPTLERAQVQLHREAIDRFQASTSGVSPLQRSGRIARDSIEAFAVLPSHEARKQAEADIIEWMSHAILAEPPEAVEDPSDRDDAMEAYMALKTGGPLIIALGLREGDPALGLTALDEARLSRALAPALRDRLEAALEGNASAYLDLFRVFDSERSSGGEGGLMSPNLAAGAAFHCALSLFQRAPQDPASVMPLSLLLLEHGLVEPATLMVAELSKSGMTTDALSFSLSLVLRGMEQLSRTDQVAAAMAVAQAGEPLLELAAKAPHQKVSPGPTEYYSLWAQVATRDGNLALASQILSRATDNTAEIALRAAEIAAQRGDLALALSHLEQARKKAEARGDVMTMALVHFTEHEVLRDQGKPKEAQELLTTSLRRALEARQLIPDRPGRQRSERLLARILFRFGEDKSARRALDRAVLLARGNTEELTPIVMDMARWGLERGDSLLLTQALLLAEENLAAEDAVYVSLWHRALTLRLGLAQDPIVLRLLSSGSRDPGWPGTLADFGLGRIGKDELRARARTEAERTEADFYAALELTPKEASERELRKIADRPHLDLMEVGIARELRAASTPWALPSDLKLLVP